MRGGYHALDQEMIRVEAGVISADRGSNGADCLLYTYRIFDIKMDSPGTVLMQQISIEQFDRQRIPKTVRSRNDLFRGTCRVGRGPHAMLRKEGFAFGLIQCDHWLRSAVQNRQHSALRIGQNLRTQNGIAGCSAERAKRVVQPL